METKKLKKVMDNNRNGIPKDMNGIPLKFGQIAEAKVVIEPKKVELDGKTWSLGPKISRICGKIVIVGPEKSWIQCKEGTKGVVNDKIEVRIA